MNEQELAQIEERAAKATPGPWEMEIDWRYEYYSTFSWACGPETTAQDDDENQASSDADFIAHAREDIPALIAEVRRLTAENARLTDALALYQANERKAIEALEEITVDILGMSGSATQPKDNAGKDALRAYYAKIHIAKEALNGKAGTS